MGFACVAGAVQIQTQPGEGFWYGGGWNWHHSHVPGRLLSSSSWVHLSFVSSFVYLFWPLCLWVYLQSPLVPEWTWSLQSQCCASSLKSSFVQVARAILENPLDKTMISLIYANVTIDDILLKVTMFYVTLLQVCFVMVKATLSVHAPFSLCPPVWTHFAQHGEMVVNLEKWSSNFIALTVHSTVVQCSILLESAYLHFYWETKLWNCWLPYKSVHFSYLYCCLGLQTILVLLFQLQLQRWKHQVLGIETDVSCVGQDDLDRFQRDYPDQFKVYYVLNEVQSSQTLSFPEVHWQVNQHPVSG